jgi:hypothetical protein
MSRPDAAQGGDGAHEGRVGSSVGHPGRLGQGRGRLKTES